ncbi:MAG: glucosyltransferase [Butyrivibrio sp.]|nr:hypothetical protein [Muribaculum sp.]MCM1551620.1 glucosyltransferase [Butyrivibrio sp.]
MSKIVFFCIPAHGHTNPTLGVVRELVSEGHDVIYYSYDIMRDKIESAGARFVSCDQYDPQTRLSKADGERIGKDLAFSTELIVNMTLAMDDAIARDMRELKPDVIVGDSMAFWAKLIAKKLGIPFVSSTTTFAFNRYSAKVMKREGPGLLRMLVSIPRIGRSIKRLQNKGYEVKSVLDIIANDDSTRTIVYTSPLFQPCSETFSENYAFVGPILRDASVRACEEADRDVEIADEGEEAPVVYISLGTVDNDHLDFYRNCLKAMEGEAWRAILSVGTDTDIGSLSKPTPNCIVRGSVDQIAVLEKADVFLTHCGMNSVSEALYYGVPLILCPKTPEQHGVANRVRELGAGIFLKESTPECIRETVRFAMKDKQMRECASAIAQSFRSCGGARAAADFILKSPQNCIEA